MTQAKETHKDVEATAATTDSATLTAHPNGTLTLNQSLAPVRKRVHGAWVKLDPTLRKNPDGTISTAVSTSALVLSGGGTGPLATMNSNGRSLAVALPMDLPAPALSGATATYPNVLSGVDLAVTADAQGGFSEVLIVKNAKAAANPALKTLTLATRTKGVKVASDHAGNITASDQAGHAVFTAPAPQMWDSSTAVGKSAASSVKDPITGQQVDPASGQPIASSPAGPGKGAHSAQIAARATSNEIALTPSASLLTGAKTVYPVYIDPDFNAPVASGPRQAWTQINSYYSSSSYWKSSDLLRVGDQNWDSPTFVARSFVQVGVPAQLYGSTVASSQINFTEEWSPSCTAKPVELWQSGGISSATTWNNPPSLISQIGSQTVAHGWDSSCPAAGVGFDISSIMQSAANNRLSDLTFALKASDETDQYGWKEFANTISVSTTYDHAPNTPTKLTTSPTTSCQDNTVVGDGTVTLYAGVSDPDGGTVGTHFQVWPHSNSSNIFASTDPNNLTNQSGSTAVYVIPESTLKKNASSGVTEFDWNVQVTDFNYTSSWSTTCHFSFDPNHPGVPVIPQPVKGSTTVGQPFSLTISQPIGSTKPSSYEYQLDGGDPANVTADAFGNATISITPRRHTDVLSVSSLSLGANYGDSASITFNNNANPAAPQADGDLTGDNVPDLLTVGGSNGMPSGLWIAGGQVDPGKTTGDGHVVTAASDIGAAGNGYSSTEGPTNFDGATAISGRFTDSGFQDVLVYYPSGTNVGSGAIYNGNGDGSPLQTRDISQNHDFSSGDLVDAYGINPTQLVNAGNTSGNNSAYADLIGLSSGGLSLYPNSGTMGLYVPSALVAATPDGTSWTNWTIATMQRAVSGGSSTAMFLWNKSTGELDLWENLGTSTDSSGNLNLTYNPYRVSASFNPGPNVTLQAADINGDSTPDLWTVGANGAVTANLFTNLSTASDATLTKITDTLATAHNTWALNDTEHGTVTTANDTTGKLTANATGNATWSTGDLFSPAADINDVHTPGTTGVLTTASPAVSTNADFTVSAWVKPQALGGYILGQDGTNTSGFAVYTDAATQTWRFEMPTSDTASPTEDTAVANGLTAQVGVWTHIAATYSAATGRMDLYVNGKDAASATHTTTWNAGGAFTIGAYKYNSARTGYLQGTVADVHAYTQALTALQLAALNGVPYVPAGTVIAQASGDFNGDGKADIAHLINCGGGHMAITVALADTNGDGGFGPVHLAWDDPSFGPGVKYMAAGDFNGDGKADLALFYNYTDNNSAHVAVFTLTATSGGGFTAPARIWDSPNFGPNTQFMSSGDFNGDGKSDLALFYNYTDNNYQHDAIFTLTAHSNGDGGFATPVTVWDDPLFGPNVKMMAAGDFNGDGKTDLALYYNYTDNNYQHDAIFTLTAHSNGDGGFASPSKIWDDTSFGPNTKYMTTGDFNGDGKTDIALFYNYTDNNGWDVAIFTMNGTATTTPKSVWSQTNWGPNSEFLVSGDFNGDGKADLAVYYNYANQTPAVFTLTADTNGDGGFAAPVRRFSDL
ncbi:LamG-like jellyroll fold domain-containing protein [Streptomyces sp. NPDC054933]